MQRFYNLNYPVAVLLLLGDKTGMLYPGVSEKKPEPPKAFELPALHSNMRRVFAYLVKQRHISPGVVAHFAKEKLLYEDAEYHNAAFVGKDENGIPRHAHKRSTNSSGKAFRMNVEGSDPKYSFHHIGTNGSLYVFEAPTFKTKYARIINIFIGGICVTDDNLKVVMDEIISALEQAGYDPREQIYGYIQTGKLQYITRHNNARNKIASLDTKQVWQYINSKSTFR